MLTSSATRTLRVVAQPHIHISSKRLSTETTDGQSPGTIASSNSIEEWKFDGGRSSVSGMIATVFGASGFLGRAVVNRLGKVGSNVIAPYRGDANHVRFLKVMGDLGQVVPVPFDVRNEESVRNTLQHSNVVINLLGRQWKTRNFSCEQSNAESAELIARVAAEMGVERMVHVSAMGVSSDSKSEWARSKAQGEEAVRTHFPNATILRPAQVFGYYDRLVMKYANLLRFHAAFPIPSPGRRFQPLFVSDFASAMEQVLRHPDETAGRIYELAGPETMTHRELVEKIAAILEIPPKHAFALPEPLVNLVTRAFYENWRTPAFVREELQWFNEGDVIKDKNQLGIEDLGIKNTSSLQDEGMTMLQLYQLPKTRHLV